MKLFTKLLLAALITALPVISTFALIPYAPIYVHPKTGQILIRLDDWHRDYKDMKETLTQQTAILRGTKLLNAAFIAEDLHTDPHDMEQLGLSPEKTALLKQHISTWNTVTACDEKIKIISATTPINADEYHHIPWQQAYDCTVMGRLTSILKKAGQQTYNTEFRNGSLVSLHGDGITVQELLQINEQIIKRILSWNNDPQCCQIYYRQLIHQYRNDPTYTALAKLAHDASAAQLQLRDLLKEPYNMNESKLHHFDYMLLNGPLVHAMHVFRNAPVLIICSGALHHEEIEPLIENLFGFGKPVAIFGHKEWRDESETALILPQLNLNMVFDAAAKMQATQLMKRTGPTNHAPLIRAKL